MDLQCEELDQLIKEAESIPTSPSPTRPSKATATSYYTLLELACCKTTLLQLQKTAKDLQSVCNEDIYNMEIVLELVLQFDMKVTTCQTDISSYRKAAKDLRNCSFDSKDTQLWSIATEVSDIIYVLLCKVKI